MLYSFAGLIIDIRFRHSFGEELCKKYRYSGSKPADFVIEIDEQMMQLERTFDIYNSSEGLLESLAAYRKICDIAFDYDCMFMHCSAIAYRGNGILFTAPSGTGKSTHAALWTKRFGEDVCVVNDDKPLLRKVNGKVYACGTPWDGKHHRSENIMVPVKAIVILSQGKVNKIEKASPQQALYHLLNQTIRPTDAAKMNRVLDFCSLIIQSVPVYTLSCNISFEAVETVFEEIKENFDEN